MNNGLVLAWETQEGSVDVVDQGAEELNLGNNHWRRHFGKRPSGACYLCEIWSSKGTVLGGWKERGRLLHLPSLNALH